MFPNLIFKEVIRFPSRVDWSYLCKVFLPVLAQKVMNNTPMMLATPAAAKPQHALPLLKHVIFYFYSRQGIKNIKPLGLGNRWGSNTNVERKGAYITQLCWA